MRRFAATQRVSADTPLDGAIETDRRRRIGELSSAKVRSSIDRALRIHAARAAAGGRVLRELQAVVQVCPAGEQYARWRKGRNRLMQRSSKRWGTGTWPEHLGAEEVAVVVLPYPAGRVGPALAAAKLVLEPVCIQGDARAREAVELLAMQLVRLWVHMAVDAEAYVLAPPVLEEFQRARVQRRTLLDCGLSSWPLPPPDGL